MQARTRKRSVERLTWGESRRCRIGRHAYVHEQQSIMQGRRVDHWSITLALLALWTLAGLSAHRDDGALYATAPRGHRG